MLVYSRGEELILTQEEEIEHLYSQAAAHGVLDAVIVVLDLSFEHAEEIARGWLGDSLVDRALAKLPNERSRVTVCIGCVTREHALLFLSQLAPEAEGLIAETLPEGQFHVVALASDGLTQTVMDSPGNLVGWN